MMSKPQASSSSNPYHSTLTPRERASMLESTEEITANSFLTVADELQQQEILSDLHAEEQEVQRKAATAETRITITKRSNETSDEDDDDDVGCTLPKRRTVEGFRDLIATQGYLGVDYDKLREREKALVNDLATRVNYETAEYNSSKLLILLRGIAMGAETKGALIEANAQAEALVNQTMLCRQLPSSLSQIQQCLEAITRHLPKHEELMNAIDGKIDKVEKKMAPAIDKRKICGQLYVEKYGCLDKYLRINREHAEIVNCIIDQFDEYVECTPEERRSVIDELATRLERLY
nr:TPA_asm: hypothetical protein [Schistorhabdovirus]